MSNTFESDHSIPASDRILIARLDERLKGIQNNLSLYQQTIVTELAAIRNDISKQSQHFDKRLVEQTADFDRKLNSVESDFRERMKEFKDKLDEHESEFVHSTQFEPIVKIVYGAVATILTVFLGAAVAFFLSHSGTPIVGN